LKNPDSHPLSPLPARLHNTGDFTSQSQLPKAQTAHLEFAQVTARPSADQTPIAAPDPEFGLLE
jgi:hypothetical protein